MNQHQARILELRSFVLLDILAIFFQLLQAHSLGNTTFANKTSLLVSIFLDNLSTTCFANNTCITASFIANDLCNNLIE